MSHQVPINLALRLLPHFDDLPREYWSNVFRLKRQFPYDSELKKNLKQLNPKLVALVRYLVWIPYNCFVKIEQVGQGDFTNVWKGTISNYMSEGGNAHDECFALKEIDESLVQEAMVYTIIANSVNIMGLTKHPKSGKYFVITEFLEGGSLEDRLSQHALDNWYSPQHLLVWFNLHFRNCPSRRAKEHVARRMAEHQRDLDAEQCESIGSLTLVDGISPAIVPSMAYRSRYYTRQQLKEFSWPTSVIQEAQWIFAPSKAS
ncbi:hypothetical protein BC938DRAFT_481263 [Jimgerdemannia flammicorona]|uniref:Serine-threonine/tyrosine-protein kinase catalytic domain-containing protein n=1 Tax=Jimgerdemannia flammicorona TaxID=994334 RepID=A0A433QX82_9FUNG|nr:hypothetical protein BC938DRAFT_481263 [Jimgerdemannia flammicorona]